MTKGIARCALLFCFAIWGWSITALAQAPKYDLLLKGGHVIDLANHTDRVMDVAIANHRIAAVEQDIPASDAGKVVDVSGYYVTPGLIDIHVHVGNGGVPLDWFTPSARHREVPEGIMTDIPLRAGVTTMVDAGSSGANNFIQEMLQVTDHSQVRLLSWLNIVQNGMFSGLEQDPDNMNPARCAQIINEFPNLIVGIKSAHYGTGFNLNSPPTPWAGIDDGIACGNMTHRPIMLDTSPVPGRSYADIITKRLRPGDIHTHVFAQQLPIILPDGKVNPIMWEARKRGVIFDVGYGSASFWWRNAAPAIQQGFLPDSISTDLHLGNVPELSLINIMSRFMVMGETLDQVIRQTTVDPAHEIHHPELGTLSVGADADIAVMQLLHGKFCYHDDGYARMCGDSSLTDVMTVRDGAIVYDPGALSMTDWQKARPQYFGHCPQGGRMFNGRRRCFSSADNFPRTVTNYERLAPPFPSQPWLQVPGNQGNNPPGAPHPPDLSLQYHSPFPDHPRAQPLANPGDTYPVENQAPGGAGGQ
ncbi:MAG: amidohydrolase family protein [Terriglobia bacterium]